MLLIEVETDSRLQLLIEPFDDVLSCSPIPHVVLQHAAAWIFMASEVACCSQEDCGIVADLELATQRNLQHHPGYDSNVLPHLVASRVSACRPQVQQSQSYSQREERLDWLRACLTWPAGAWTSCRTCCNASKAMEFMFIQDTSIRCYIIHPPKKCAVSWAFGDWSCLLSCLAQ